MRFHRRTLVSCSFALGIAGGGSGPACTKGASTDADAPKRTTATRNAEASPGSRPATRGADPQPGAAAPVTGEPERRAAAAQARLERTPAGRLVLKSTEHHGGLDAWFAQEALRFRYDYRPQAGTRRASVQTVDVLKARVYHDLEHPVDGRFAFDGATAWMKLDGGAAYPARFWALTPYYFVGMPFVLGDPGVNLAIVDDDPRAAGFAAADVVKATFDPGTGDAPEDYYVLYLAPETGRLLGLRYVVSYAPFMQDGMEHTPEKLLVYEAYEPVGPLTLARRHAFFAFGEGRKGKQVTTALVSDVKYGADFDESKLVMPEGAVVDDSLESTR